MWVNSGTVGMTQRGREKIVRNNTGLCSDVEEQFYQSMFYVHILESTYIYISFCQFVWEREREKERGERERERKRGRRKWELFK